MLTLSFILLCLPSPVNEREDGTAIFIGPNDIDSVEPREIAGTGGLVGDSSSFATEVSAIEGQS
jgi:hypothetical protein